MTCGCVLQSESSLNFHLGVFIELSLHRHEYLNPWRLATDHGNGTTSTHVGLVLAHDHFYHKFRTERVSIY